MSPAPGHVVVHTAFPFMARWVTLEGKVINEGAVQWAKGNAELANCWASSVPGASHVASWLCPNKPGRAVAPLHSWGVGVEQENPQMRDTNMVAHTRNPSTWEAEIGGLL